MLVVALVLMVALSAVYIAGRERNKKKVLAFKALATLVADFLALGLARTWRWKSSFCTGCLCSPSGMSAWPWEC